MTVPCSADCGTLFVAVGNTSRDEPVDDDSGDEASGDSTGVAEFACGWDVTLELCRTGENTTPEESMLLLESHAGGCAHHTKPPTAAPTPGVMHSGVPDEPELTNEEIAMITAGGGTGLVVILLTLLAMFQPQAVRVAAKIIKNVVKWAIRAAGLDKVCCVEVYDPKFHDAFKDAKARLDPTWLSFQCCTAEPSPILKLACPACCDRVLDAQFNSACSTLQAWHAYFSFEVISRRLRKRLTGAGGGVGGVDPVAHVTDTIGTTNIHYYPDPVASVVHTEPRQSVEDQAQQTQTVQKLVCCACCDRQADALSFVFTEEGVNNHTPGQVRDGFSTDGRDFMLEAVDGLGTMSGLGDPNRSPIEPVVTEQPTRSTVEGGSLASTPSAAAGNGKNSIRQSLLGSSQQLSDDLGGANRIASGNVAAVDACVITPPNAAPLLSAPNWACVREIPGAIGSTTADTPARGEKELEALSDHGVEVDCWENSDEWTPSSWKEAYKNRGDDPSRPPQRSTPDTPPTSDSDEDASYLDIAENASHGAAQLEFRGSAADPPVTALPQPQYADLDDRASTTDSIEGEAPSSRDADVSMTTMDSVSMSSRGGLNPLFESNEGTQTADAF